MNLMKGPRIEIKFHGSKIVNGVMKLVLKDARDAVKMAATNPQLNRQVILDLKELLAIAENNELALRKEQL